MSLNLNPQTQSYWYVVREEHENVVFSTNYTQFAVQPQTSDGRFVINEEGNREYVPAPEPSQADVEVPHEPEEPTETKPTQFWDRQRVKLLLNWSSASKYKQLNLLKDKYAWNEIAPAIGTTPKECMKKYLNMRNTYLRLHRKKLLGKEIKWIYYSLCNEVFRRHIVSPESLEVWSDVKIRTLLNWYIDNSGRILKSPAIRKDLWKEIASILGTTDYSCRHKLKCLKRTYFKIVERREQTGKCMRWPYTGLLERIVHAQDIANRWTNEKIRILLDAYVDRMHRFADPLISRRDLWEEIGTIVGENPDSCDKKFRNLKMTYIRLKSAEGNRPVKWRYFKDFETINKDLFFKKHKDLKQNKKILDFYLQHLEQFQSPLIKNKKLWRELADNVGLSTYDCDKRFRNLKQTYLRLHDLKQRTGKFDSDWPYFAYFEQILKKAETPDEIPSNNDRVEEFMIKELNKALDIDREVRDNSNKFERLTESLIESNEIQRERNRILQALLDRY